MKKNILILLMSIMVFLIPVGSISANEETPTIDSTSVNNLPNIGENEEAFNSWLRTGETTGNTSWNVPNISNGSLSSLSSRIGNTEGLATTTNRIINTTNTQANSLTERMKANALNSSRSYKNAALDGTSNIVNTLRNNYNSTNPVGTSVGTTDVTSLGGDSMLDRIGMLIEHYGTQGIGVLTMFFFYATIISAIGCGIMAVINIFRGKDVWRYLIGSVMSIVVFLVVVSITGIDITNTGLIEVINWVFYG